MDVARESPLQVTNRLHNLLSLADDEALFRLVWATVTLQSDQPQPAMNFIKGYPEAAISPTYTDRYKIYPWLLETLINELLARPKHNLYRALKCGEWNTVIELRNLLHSLDGADYVDRRDKVPILHELPRILARQIPWQRQALTIQNLYRSIFIFGQGSCKDYFENTYGLSINDLTLFGVGLRGTYDDSPVYRSDTSATAIGLDRVTIGKALGRLCAPIETARELAFCNRTINLSTAYKPSVLRQFPCIAFGPKRRRIYAPIPDLIVERITTGLFYDIIGGGQRVREEYGKRFEEYARKFLRAMLPDSTLKDEWRYRVTKQSFDSPDLIGIGENQKVAFVIECKAHRMSHAARFGEAAAGEAGYENMAEAIVQIWRFLSHCRTGHTGIATNDDVVGMVLTLDDWLMGNSETIKSVMKRSNEIANNYQRPIEPEDRCPVVFCPMADLEAAAAYATDASFKAALVRSSAPERTGYLFSTVHDEIDVPKAEFKPYPFTEDLGKILPWWDELKE